MCPSPDHGAKDAPTRYKVLVVDDEPTLRLGFSYALAEHEIDTAAGGQEALEKIGAGGYDVVILDLRMPDVDGLQVIETLRRAGNFTPIVLCSAAVSPGAALRAIRGQVVDFLLKPVCPAELRGAIGSVLEPGGDPLARAMVHTRAGRIDDAIHGLENEAGESPRVATWLAILRGIRLDTAEGESKVLSKLEREGLANLAYSHPQG